MAYTTIDNPELYYQSQLYTGNGSANHAITLGGSEDMQPDLVWIKNRDQTDQHCWFDSTRGATKMIGSNITTAQVTATDTLDSFTSDGFQVDADVKVNTNTEKYVAWCWKESATSGVDIVSYTGNDTARTISHSLSAVPHFIYIELLAAAHHSVIYHHENTAAPETDYLVLNTNAATSDSATIFNDTAPTSSVFSVGSAEQTNDDGNALIAYVFTSIQGFSKFGGYVGNGNVDGTFIYTGFRPAWILIKKTSGAGSWYMHDNKREGFNGIAHNYGNDVLEPHNANAEAEGYLDIVSNGFKIRSTGVGINNSGSPHVFMAFAEAPLVNSNGVPCNAR